MPTHPAPANALDLPAGTMVQLHPSTATFSEKVLCTVGEIPGAKRDLFASKIPIALSPFLPFSLSPFSG